MSTQPPYSFDVAAKVSKTGSQLTILPDRAPRCFILPSGVLGILGTSAAEPSQLWEDRYVPVLVATTSAPAGYLTEIADASRDNAEETTDQAISEIRLISGLTWEQLSELFGVSRRSVHFWASGKPLNAANEARLMQTLDVIREADRGDAQSTRAALFYTRDGVTPFDLLADGQFRAARARLGKGPGREKIVLTELSAAAKAARKPLPPGELIDAIHDTVHRDASKGRAARTARNNRRGRG